MNFDHYLISESQFEWYKEHARPATLQLLAEMEEVDDDIDMCNIQRMNMTNPQVDGDTAIRNAWNEGEKFYATTSASKTSPGKMRLTTCSSSDTSHCSNTIKHSCSPSRSNDSRLLCDSMLESTIEYSPPLYSDSDDEGAVDKREVSKSPSLDKGKISKPCMLDNGEVSKSPSRNKGKVSEPPVLNKKKGVHKSPSLNKGVVSKSPSLHKEVSKSHSMNKEEVSKSPSLNKEEVSKSPSLHERDANESPPVIKRETNSYHSLNKDKKFPSPVLFMGPVVVIPSHENLNETSINVLQPIVVSDDGYLPHFQSPRLQDKKPCDIDSSNEFVCINTGNANAESGSEHDHARRGPTLRKRKVSPSRMKKELSTNMKRSRDNGLHHPLENLSKFETIESPSKKTPEFSFESSPLNGEDQKRFDIIDECLLSILSPMLRDTSIGSNGQNFVKARKMTRLASKALSRRRRELFLDGHKTRSHQDSETATDGQSVDNPLMADCAEVDKSHHSPQYNSLKKCVRIEIIPTNCKGIEEIKPVKDFGSNYSLLEACRFRGFLKMKAKDVSPQSSRGRTESAECRERQERQKKVNSGVETGCPECPLGNNTHLHNDNNPDNSTSSTARPKTCVALGLKTSKNNLEMNPFETLDFSKRSKKSVQKDMTISPQSSQHTNSPPSQTDIVSPSPPPANVKTMSTVMSAKQKDATSLVNGTLHYVTFTEPMGPNSRLSTEANLTHSRSTSKQTTLIGMSDDNSEIRNNLITVSSNDSALSPQSNSNHQSESESRRCASTVETSDEMIETRLQPDIGEEKYSDKINVSHLLQSQGFVPHPFSPSDSDSNQSV